MSFDIFKYPNMNTIPHRKTAKIVDRPASIRPTHVLEDTHGARTSEKSLSQKHRVVDPLM